MTRCTMPAGSQGELYAQRAAAELVGEDVHRWLVQRLDNFYCDLQVMYVPLVRHCPARTHVVLNNTPPLSSLSRTDEAVEATGLNPHLSVCGRPFCLNDANDGRRKERGMTAMYIALEGPDGVGKSTVAAALKKRLQKRTQPDHAPSRPTVRIRHFPTDTLVQCANNEGYCLKAEDYAMDMENWLSLRPEPVLFPDAPTPAAESAERPETLYILDRWALSTAVYASLRNERVSENIALTLNWLNRVPLATFVLMPRDPVALTDPDYPGPDPYNPLRVTEAYRTFLTNAFVAGELSRFIPIVVDRTLDTPDSVAAEIAEWMAGLM